MFPEHSTTLEPVSPSRKRFWDPVRQDAAFSAPGAVGSAVEPHESFPDRQSDSPKLYDAGPKRYGLTLTIAGSDSPTTLSATPLVRDLPRSRVSKDLELRNSSGSNVSRSLVEPGTFPSAVKNSRPPSSHKPILPLRPKPLKKVYRCPRDGCGKEYDKRSALQVHLDSHDKKKREFHLHCTVSPDLVQFCYGPTCTSKPHVANHEISYLQHSVA